jgi:hypothetical protein
MAGEHDREPRPYARAQERRHPRRQHAPLDELVERRERHAGEVSALTPNECPGGADPPRGRTPGGTRMPDPKVRDLLLALVDEHSAQQALNTDPHPYHALTATALEQRILG